MDATDSSAYAMQWMQLTLGDMLCNGNIEPQ